MDPTVENKSVKEQNTYNQYADRYAQDYISDAERGQFNFSRDVVIPPLLDLVGNVAGLTVLDAGCGEGIVSRLLAERGAQVTGIDVAPRFIELARERDRTGAIRYLCHDLSQPLPAYHEHFDQVVSNFVLNDVPDYQGFVATLATFLKTGGRIVLSMNNPYSAVMREKVENYFDSGRSTLYSMAQRGIAVYYYHRTMEEYVTAFAEQGLLLRRLIDVRMSPELVARFPSEIARFSLLYS
ncbi:MAG: methyltransferase domain-containing protein [Caldilineaceae bacterium]